MADAAQSPGDFPYTGPGDAWALPRPGGRGPSQPAGPANHPAGGYGPESPTGPFKTWPPPWRGARVQNFVGALPNRPSQMWGDPGQFPKEPEPWQTPGIYRGVGGELSQWGSGFVAPVAGVLNRFAGSFLSGYGEGQAERQRLIHQQMTDYAEQLAMRQTQELQDYRDVHTAFGGDPTTGAGEDRNITLEGIGKWEQGIRSVATMYNDRPMLAALDSGNYKLVENILKWRDSKNRDLKASVSAQRKDQDERDKEAPWLAPGIKPQSPAGPPVEEPAETPDDSSAVASPDEGGPAPETAPPAPPSPTSPPAEPAPADGGYKPSLEPIAAAPAQPRGIQVAEAGASDVAPSWAGPLAQADAARGDRVRPTQPPAAPFQPTPDEILPNARGNGGLPLNQTMIGQLAQDLVNGDVAPSAMKNYPKTVWNYANARAKVIEGDLKRIEQDPRLKGEAVLRAIRTVDPQLADEVKNYALGTVPPPRGASALKPPWDRIVTLGGKYDSSFTGATFQTRAATLRDFTSGQDGRNLVSIATAYAHLKAVQRDLQRRPGWWASLFGRFRDMWGVSAEDRQAIGALDQDINTAAAEYERALTGGKPTVTGRDEQMSDLNWRINDMGVLQSNVQAKIDRLKERMDRLKEYFTAGTGRQPQDMFKLFESFSRSGASSAGADDLGATGVADPAMSNDLRTLDGEKGAAGGGEKIHDSSDYFK